MFDSIWGFLFIPINLLIPMVFCFSGKKFTLPNIKKIVIINGICVFLLYTILRAVEGIEGTPYGVVIWSYVAYMIMKKKCLKKEDDPEHIKIDIETILEESADKHPEVEQTPRVEVKPTPAPKKKPKVAITVIVITVLSILLFFSILFNIIQYIGDNDISKYEEDEQILDLEYSLNAHYWKLSEKAEFLDENIVFVIDGYGKYYFTYDKMIEITEDDDHYEFWAYNKELAIDLGYKAYYN